MILVMRSISVLFIDVAGARRRYESEVAFFSIFFSQKKIINRKKIRNLKGTVCPNLSDGSESIRVYRERSRIVPVAVGISEREKVPWIKFLPF